MADGNYETENSIDRRISAAMSIMAKPLRNDIQMLRAQLAEAEVRILEAERVAKVAGVKADALSSEVAALRDELNKVR